MIRKVQGQKGVIEYNFTYKKVKNINLRINRSGEINVSAPFRVREKTLDSFVLNKEEFILRALARIKEAQAKFEFIQNQNQNQGGGGSQFGSQFGGQPQNQNQPQPGSEFGGMAQNQNQPQSQNQSGGQPQNPNQVQPGGQFQGQNQNQSGGQPGGGSQFGSQTQNQNQPQSQSGCGGQPGGESQFGGQPGGQFGGQPGGRCGYKPIEAYTRAEILAMFNQVSEQVLPLFAKYNVAKPLIKIRKMKSMWGSCKYNAGIITMNSVLMNAPRHLTEYVMVHEYCHFIHPNHSKAFYSLLSEMMPDWKLRKQQLREYSYLLRS